MPEAAALPPGTPDPLHGHVPIPPGSANSPADKFPAPPLSPGSSPLGSASQYLHAPSIPSLHNQVSVTGATKIDPVGEKARQAVLRDPDWASPMRAFWLVLVRGYAVSFLTYWFGYGFFLMFGLGAAQLLMGGPNHVTGAMLSEALVVGPIYGIILDLSLTASTSAAAAFGFVFLPMELVLLVLFLITFEWSTRLKYCGLMLGLVWLKAALFVWVNSIG